MTDWGAKLRELQVTLNRIETALAAKDMRIKELEKLVRECPIEYTASGPENGYATVNGDDGKAWMKRREAYFSRPKPT